MSRATQDPATLRMLARTGLSPSTARLSGRFRFASFLRHRGPTTPLRPEPQGFGLFPGRSPLLGESLLFSSPRGTKMFQFPAFASSIRKIPESLPVGCPIRKSAHQRPFAPPRGLSQLIASFIACKSLGIHRTPFLTCYASFLSLRKESEKRVLKVYFWLTPFRLLYVFIFTHSLYQQGCATIRVRLFSVSLLICCTVCHRSHGLFSPTWRITDSNR